jgi:MFS transporter, PAT family, solute carrier family 33 (acetyl-CoA transportor), member 1
MTTSEFVKITSPDDKKEAVKEQENFSLKGDYKNIFLLVTLYILQGIPQGLTMAVPILLQNRGVSYADQAGFSFAYFPFASKIQFFSISIFFFRHKVI